MADYYLLNTTSLGTTVFPAGALIVGVADPASELQSQGGILVPTTSASEALLRAIGRAQQARSKGASFQQLDSIVLTAFFADSISSSQEDISQLLSAVATLQGNVTALQGSVSTLQGDVSTLQGDVSLLQSDVSTLQGDVAGINTRLGARLVNALVDVTDDPLNPVVLGGFGLASVTHLATGHYRLNLSVSISPTAQAPIVQLLGGLGVTAEGWSTQLAWTSNTTYELWIVKSTTVGGVVFANNDFYFQLYDNSIS